jgi:beta-phosphoglucomutase
MKYKGIIFDLDGVICSTDEYHYQAWKALADRLGIPFDRERNNLLRGVSRMESLNIILEKSEIAYTEKKS